MDAANVLETLYTLSVNKSSGHESPHKAVLLLTLFDLIESGRAHGNRFKIDDVLIDTWSSYFSIVRAGRDKPNWNNPLYHLSFDRIWKLIPKNGGPDPYRSPGTGGTPSKTWIRSNIDFGQLDPAVYRLASSPLTVPHLRAAVISRYFPAHWDALHMQSSTNIMSLSGEPRVGQELDDGSSLADARDAAFRKLIVDLYDNRCAACRLAMVVDDIVFVDAAHLIPWNESHNDYPTNGLALCKNHHWAMDRHIIAPGVDRLWHVSGRVDPQIRDNLELINLEGRELLPPSDPDYVPDEAYLRWREDRLLA